MSRPARGAWVEIKKKSSTRKTIKSRPARGAWVEILRLVAAIAAEKKSRPARGAWVEIIPETAS